jgi:8-oxo-dGTP pyrophosphatase MutT (NUDIX family)
MYGRPIIRCASSAERSTTVAATLHPHPDENGRPVILHHPSLPTPLDNWSHPGLVATVIPGGAMPPVLNGIAVTPCTLAAQASEQGTAPAIDEPAFAPPPGFRAAAGTVIVEDDGRVWLVAPSNGFGGYRATFPKGRVDPGGTLQHTALREAFEESGLVVGLVAFLLDVRRTQTYTRYYIARRLAGSPAEMGWETQAVHLVPKNDLDRIAVHPNDASVTRAARAWMDEFA